MHHFKAVPQTPNHDLRQLRRVVWSIVSNAVDRSNKTNIDMQQGGFGGVTTFICRLPRIIKIVTVDMLHELFDNYPLNQF